MKLEDYAKSELDRLNDGSEEQSAVNKDILAVLDLLGSQGHSGMSIQYVLKMINQLVNFYPVTPLTGADDEWSKPMSLNGESTQQNLRCSSVFRVTGDNTTAHDVERLSHSYGNSKSQWSGPHYYLRFPYMPSYNKHDNIVVPEYFGTEDAPRLTQKEYAMYAKTQGLRDHILNNL